MAGTCGYGEELSGSINAGNFLTSRQSLLVSFSRRALLHGVSKYTQTADYYFWVVYRVCRVRGGANRTYILTIPCCVMMTDLYLVWQFMSYKLPH